MCHSTGRRVILFLKYEKKSLQLN